MTVAGPQSSPAGSSLQLPIGRLIDLVRKGGRVRTGIDLRNQQGVLLLEKNVLVDDPEVLLKAQAQGATLVAVAERDNGGLWDRAGNRVRLPSHHEVAVGAVPPSEDAKVGHAAAEPEVEQRLEEIVAVKKIAAVKYEKAKSCIQRVLNSIRATGGEFDYQPVAETVSDLVDFVSKNENSFAYLAREIFSYDDYLYNHSINVCTIGTVVMQRFNKSFSAAVNSFLDSRAGQLGSATARDQDSFIYFTPSEMLDISIGFFMHDLGKVMVAPEILNKPGRLTTEEFAEVKSHVTDKAARVLEKNKITDPHIVNVCNYHHASLYQGEERSYPDYDPHMVPVYVKVCKLADIYDAMTSKRCYKDAMNPVGVVTDIFHQYAGKNPLLQYVLHSFIKSVGIYPAGSVVTLTNGQLAYVLDSNGPMLLPITDPQGDPLARRQAVVVPGKPARPGAAPLAVDRNRAPVCPLEAYRVMPDYLRRTIEKDIEQMPIN